MINISDIKDIHIELTTLCNARCPLCIRNAHGYPHNFGFPETSLSVEQVQQILSVEFIQQLTTFTICGNYGDFVACPDALAIVEYVRSSNPDLRITVSTNGSARNSKFWTRLAELGVEVSFCIDGLEDTHTLYRLDTNWQQIIENAKSFISAGGSAVWKMIKFEHNSHQVEECKQLARELGFIQFDLTDHSRSNGAVFDRNKNLTHVIGSGPHYSTVEQVIQWYNKDIADDYMLNKPPMEEVTCYTKEHQSVYIAANGEVYPCCFIGFYPQTFSNSHWFKESNRQIAELIGVNSNNALDVGFESAMAWFNEFESRWKLHTYEEGRLRGCDEHCGKLKYVYLDKDRLS